MSEPLNIDAFKKLDPLAKGYEFRPGCAYLIVVGKGFDQGHAQSLFRDILQMHPDVQVAVVATLHPKEIEVRERKSAGQESESMPTGDEKQKSEQSCEE